MRSRLVFEEVQDNLVHSLSDRDAALWIGHDFEDTGEIDAICQLIRLPWRLVLCESPASGFTRALDQTVQAPNDTLARIRGFLHIVAGDPEGITLPPRALPIFLLNGRKDSSDPSEAYRPAGMAQLRRRLNMLNMLLLARPRSLVVLSKNDPDLFAELTGLWKEGFRALPAVVTSSHEDEISVNEWIARENGLAAVDFYPLQISVFASQLSLRVNQLFPDQKLFVRIRGTDDRTLDLDITNCELPEQPLLDRYEVIQSKELRLLQPQELPQDQFNHFFDKAQESWAPYAAGLPWERNQKQTKKVINALRSLAGGSPDDNRIFFIPSEPGAGGTTLARTIAFAAAYTGYPTIVARSLKFHPQATEVASFLFRAQQAYGNQFPMRGTGLELPQNNLPEITWLIVFDVSHWKGREAELRSFLSELSRSGRSVLVLLVTGTDVPEELTNSGRATQLDPLEHELSNDEARALGQHLNRFLRVYGKEKTDGEWLTFWNLHRPNISTSVAAFWIALEFWIKGQFDLSESIQSWLYGQFKELHSDSSLKLLLLEIAALSIERQPLPEGLMVHLPDQTFPLSVLLERIRSDAPALALVQDSTGTHRQWAMAHDLLGRYLITSSFYDRSMLATLQLDTVVDPVDLRLMLLRRVATRSDLARTTYLPLGIEFAVNIFKLDQNGNTEFFRYWRKVIDILKSMPVALRESSRTFNHHVAISCRRVVKMKEYFDASPDEQRELLLYAIDRLEYAINSLERAPDDDSDLNLFNSLSLAYQDLAECEQIAGSDEKRVRELHQKAADAVRRAHEEGPSNSYALETMARHLLQNAELYTEERASSASEALGFIYQALSLDRSDLRQSQLVTLANQALRLLRSTESTSRIDQLCEAGNPLGFLARAWLRVTEGLQSFQYDDFSHFPADNVRAALELLKGTEQHANWLILRFKYDLITAGRPYSFEEQLSLLDELVGTRYRLPHQLQIERAILLYQLHRNFEANAMFRDLRRELKTYDVIVVVPQRLRWLLADDHARRRQCDAVVVNDLGYRCVAKVHDLADAMVPLIPQEFNTQRMAVRQRIKCWINFGPMGPFIKPITQDDSESSD